MAKFIVNSSGTRAVRKDEVQDIYITPYIEEIEGGSSTTYRLRIIMAKSKPLIFEMDDTLEGIQSKAITVLTALES